MKDKYNFDEIIDRKNSRCHKWDGENPMYRKSENLLPLWVADMDFQSPKPIIDALIKRAKHGFFGYTFFPDEYYEAVINWFQRRYNWKLEKNWIIYTPGVLPGLCLSVQAYSEPGDKVIIQTPAYPPFVSSVKDNGCKPLINPLKLTNSRYEMDFEDLKEKVKDPKVKMIILCNPHNPTGRVWTKEELTQFGEICLENQVLVISDEIHADIIYPGSHNFTAFASISDEFAQNSITCTSPSKPFNYPSLKVSNIIIPNTKLRGKFIIQRTKLHIRDPNSFASVVVEATYNECEDWLEEMLMYIKQNLEFLKSFIKQNLPQVKVIEPEGTYLVWLDFRDFGYSTKELTSIIKGKAKVALEDGFLFSKDGRGFQRINIGCPRSILEEALTRISNAFNSE